MKSYLEAAKEDSGNITSLNETMSYERQETILSAIAQSITGNLTVKVHIRPTNTGESYTDRNDIYVGDDESLLKVYVRLNRRKKVNPFLMRLKLVAHETLHSLFTPYKIYESERVSLVLEGYSPHQVKHVFDVIENLIIETREPSVFGGWLHSAFLYGSYTQYSCTRKLQYIQDHLQWETAILNLQNTCNLEDGMRLRGHFSSEKAKDLYERTKPMIEDILNSSHSTSDKVAIIKDVVRMVIDTFPETRSVSDEELHRKPMNSRTADLPSIEENLLLPDETGQESELTDEDKRENKENSEERNADRDNTDDKHLEEGETGEESEDAENEKDFSENEERKFDSDRKLNKLMKQINQYAVSLERIEKNSCMSENAITKEFGENIAHVEKHTGSLTVLPEDREFYRKSVMENKQLIRSLNALFKKELKRIRDEDEYFTSGKIDPVRVVSHRRKTVELFKRPLGDSGTNEAAITVRIDQSGSMSNRYSRRGRKLCDEAGELACVLTEVFADLKVSLQVCGFAEVGVEEEHEIFKEFNSSTTPRETVAKSRLNKSSATPTGWTIYQGIQELKARQEKNKVFILITDGYPSSQVSRLFMSINHIRKHIRNAQKEGIAFLCLLVGECEPSLHHKIFGDSLIVAGSSTSLAVAISPKLKKVAKRWNN
ncbi:MAG: hypothetical protein E7A81_02190 [Clostridiales bacterium]|nr:hypothetical protein [Clostridiales bacterium]MDU1041783.1 hypothetical protein [Clostridiales bacterium]MDU3489602.1 hypothetical protein [Clostridiales bacterium]